MQSIATLIGFLNLLGGPLSQQQSRPPREDHAAMARYIIHANDYGTLATRSRHLSGAPFANLVSLSDGAVGNSTGRLLFYLTPMDSTAYDLQKDSTASFAAGEAQLPGGCGSVDPEDPTCAKVSITGRMLPVPSSELPLAEQMLFSRHPVMRTWPDDHGFTAYELHPEEVRLLDFYGSAALVPVSEYYSVPSRAVYA